MKRTQRNSFTLQQEMLHRIILQSSHLANFGLFSGRMGVVLFLVNYSKQTSDARYEDIADELMTEIWEEVHKFLPIGFESGLSGIGWGIEYLIQCAFVEGDSLDVCEDIDNKIMELDPLRISDYSLETGLEGLLHYVLAHVKGCMLQNTSLPFDTEYIMRLHQAINRCSCDKQSCSFLDLRDLFNNFIETNTTPSYSFPILSFIDEIELQEKKIQTYSIGMQKGLSGVILKNILTKLI